MFLILQMNKILILTSSSFLAGVKVNAAPCVAETPMYGQATTSVYDDKLGKDIVVDLKPGQNGVTETYWVVDDDDFTRLRGIEACVEDGFIPKEHFKGFRAEIYSPTSGT